MKLRQDVEITSWSREVEVEVEGSKLSYFDTGSQHTSVDRHVISTPGHYFVGCRQVMAPLGNPGTAQHDRRMRHVMVSVSSAAYDVSLALKPSVIASEERQARLNDSVRLGFLPPKQSTAG